MRSNGLPKDAAVATLVERHDNNVIRTEGRESFQCALKVTENNSDARKWLLENKDLYRRRKSR